MPTATENLYTAAAAMMSIVNGSAPTTLSQAPTSYGSDFRITPGSGLYQIQASYGGYFFRSNQKYPIIVLTILIHHNVNSSSNETSFLGQTIDLARSTLLDRSAWADGVGYGIHEVDRDEYLSIGEVSRIGNVITFEFRGTMLMDPE